jgi:hemerythrin superfamily protein
MERLLTSTVVNKNDDNNYSQSQCHLLIPHEAIRRELLRAEKAVLNMDIVKHPWHIKAFLKWYLTCFVPFIHDHHNNEEKISFPFWNKLGAIAMPTKQCDDHVTLMKIIDDLRVLGEELKSSTDVPDINEDVIVNKTKEFKAKFAYLKQHTLDHLAEEELYWQPIYEKYGEGGEMIKKDQDNVISHGLSTKGDEFIGFKMAFCSVSTAMGVKGLNPSIGRYGPVNYKLPPWCSQKLADDFYNELPWIPKVLVFPSWLDVYEKYVVLVDSINGDVNVMDKLFPEHDGCHCVIS